MPLITITDLCERLKRIDEVTLLELLHLRSEDIVDRFEDIIIKKSFELQEELDDTEEENDEY
jgi:hypothetical protein